MLILDHFQWCALELELHQLRALKTIFVYCRRSTYLFISLIFFFSSRHWRCILVSCRWSSSWPSTTTLTPPRCWRALCGGKLSVCGQTAPLWPLHLPVPCPLSGRGRSFSGRQQPRGAGLCCLSDSASLRKWRGAESEGRTSAGSRIKVVVVVVGGSSAEHLFG